MSNTKLDDTRRAIMSQLRENTGRALCDSGDYYGRNFTRNQGKTWEELAYGIKQEASVYTYRTPHELELTATVSLASYMENNLSYRPDIQEAYEKFVEEQDRDNYYDCELMQKFADQCGFGVEDCRSVSYSYNWDNCFSQNIQFIVFDYEGDKVALIQVHGGCDARSGLTAPKAYEIRGDHYLGDCVINIYYCDDDGFGKYPDEHYVDDLDELKHLPVFEFEYASNLDADIENLKLTDKYSEDTVAKMKAQDSVNEYDAFVEFCDNLEFHSIVVRQSDKQAYFVGDNGPKMIYAESYSLMG